MATFRPHFTKHGPITKIICIQNQEYHYALKKSIAYTVALHIRLICLTATKYTKHSKALENALVNKGYCYLTNVTMLVSFVTFHINAKLKEVIRDNGITYSRK